MMTPGTVNADFEPTGHLPLHRLPVTTSGESLRRCSSDLDQNRAHRRSHLKRAGIEEFPSQYCLVRSIVLVAAEKRNIVLIVR
jgi:hypothetical protein